MEERKNIELKRRRYIKKKKTEMYANTHHVRSTHTVPKTNPVIWPKIWRQLVLARNKEAGGWHPLLLLLQVVTNEPSQAGCSSFLRPGMEPPAIFLCPHFGPSALLSFSLTLQVADQRPQCLPSPNYPAKSWARFWETSTMSAFFPRPCLLADISSRHSRRAMALRPRSFAIKSPRPFFHMQLH